MLLALFSLIISVSVQGVVFSQYPEKLSEVLKRLNVSGDNILPFIATTAIPNYLIANSTLFFQISVEDKESGINYFNGEIINFDKIKTSTLDLFDDGLHNDGLFNDSFYSATLNTNDLMNNNNFIFLTAVDNAGNKKVLVKEIKEIISPKTCSQLVDNNNTNDKLDIVFLGDKYFDLEILRKDVENHYKSIFKLSPLDKAFNQSKINIHFVNATLDLFCQRNIPIGMNLTPQLHWVGCDHEKISLISSNCPNDVVMVVLNNKTYAGTSWGAYAITYKDGDKSNTTVHEFGHIFGALNDEYSYGINADKTMLPGGVNCDINKSCGKWQNISNTGCFQECSYNNWFRPIHNNTIMYDAKGDFGSVNEAELNRRLSKYT